MADTSTPGTIRVDIWSDVVCPWCYIGKRRFERAVDELGDELDISITYRPYQLDPTASPGTSQPVFEAYSKKFGGDDQARAIIDRVTTVAAEDGLEFQMDRALRANTLLAHRLLWYADRPGSAAAQDAVKERLLRAYFVDGLDIGDPDVLVGCAVELGFDPDDIARFLDSDAGRDEVAADLSNAAELGITAVPTFVINDTWAIPGAQDTDVFVRVLERLRERLISDDTADDSARDDQPA